MLYLLKETNLDFCSHDFFAKMQQTPYYLTLLVQTVQEAWGNDFIEIPSRIEHALRNADKALFLKFRNRELTFNQLKARSAELNGLGSYVTLDDIKDEIQHILDIIEKKEGAKEGRAQRASIGYGLRSKTEERTLKTKISLNAYEDQCSGTAENKTRFNKTNFKETR